MKIAILCDHYPLSPRVIKVRNSILSINQSAEVRVFAWNRENQKIKEEFVDAISDDTGYGNKIRKLTNLLSFAKNVKRHIQKFQPEIIHAIDFEMLAIANTIPSKRHKIIYEVYDIKFFSNQTINLFRTTIERILLKKNKYGMILASPFFKEYYKKLLKGNLPNTIILNNKPSKRVEINSKENCIVGKVQKGLKYEIIIGFIGTVRYKDILLNLIESACQFKNIKILIAGGGPDYKIIEQYIAENNLSVKVILTGPYDSNQIKEIYDICDYIWAAYPSKDENVKYAISNKFFESRVYGKKSIVSQNTLLGDTVEKYNIGYTVNPYEIDSIINVMSQLTLNDENNGFDTSKSKMPDWLTDLYWESEEKFLNELYRTE